jgi:hypothetical protein
MGAWVQDTIRVLHTEISTAPNAACMRITSASSEIALTSMDLLALMKREC